ncbi:hypothetical protein F5880DRAFT_1502729 [Lentinula raphanica]|nr:hypothetical protein F5880DRAFT_1502729 [Lentinula raphanica]
MLYLSFMSRSLLMGLLCTIFIGAFSSPLPLTPNNTTSLVGRLEERYQVARGYSGQFSSLTMRLYRTHKDGKAITPGTKMTKDEDWILFIGPDGFRAHAGPGGTLVAETMKSDKTRLGHSVSSSKLTLDLGEKAGFHTAAARDKAFQQLLTEIPALHAGNGVPKTNLAYLNGIFAYLASVEAVSNREPPETPSSRMICAQSLAITGGVLANETTALTDYAASDEKPSYGRPKGLVEIQTKNERSRKRVLNIERREKIRKRLARSGEVLVTTKVP